MADNTILQAAKSIRSENQKHSDVRDIFFKSGLDYFDTMSFEFDILVRKEAEDDLGQIAKATITSLRYALELKLNDSKNEHEPIEIIKEELRPITLTDTKKNLYFEYENNWIDSVLFRTTFDKKPLYFN